MNFLYTLLINLCAKGLKPVSEKTEPVGLGDLIHEMLTLHAKRKVGEEEPYWQDTEYYDVYLELNRLVPDVSKKKELK